MGQKPREPKSWRRYVERERLVSTMNATKWHETTEAMRRLIGGPPGFRIKDIRGPEPELEACDREWYYHPRPWETNEWLEIHPDPRHDEIVAILKAIGAPISFEGGPNSDLGMATPRYVAGIRVISGREDTAVPMGENLADPLGWRVESSRGPGQSKETTRISERHSRIELKVNLDQ